MENKFNAAQTMEMIMKDGICPLAYPITFNGTTYDAAMRVTRAKVKHRIEASAFCKDNYRGNDIPDVIMAYLASDIVEFGVLIEQEPELDEPLVIENEPESRESDDTSDEDANATPNVKYSLKDRSKLPVDVLINDLDYVDMVMMQHLLGKK